MILYILYYHNIHNNIMSYIESANLLPSIIVDTANANARTVPRM